MLSNRVPPPSGTAFIASNSSAKRWQYQPWILASTAFSPSLCEMVWWSSLAPTQLWRIWLKPREYCSEAIRVRSEARAATTSRFMIGMSFG